MEIKPLPLIIALAVLVVAGGLLWFVLTRPAPTGPGNTATTTPSGVETGVKLRIEDTGPYHEATATHPSATPIKVSAGMSADSAAVSLMKTFAEKEIARFIDNSVISLTPEDVRVQGLGGERKYVLDMDYDVFESPQTVSYLYHMFADTLGAHPNAYYRTFTFDKKTGEGLHLDNLFIDDSYVDVLSAKSRTSLEATLGDNASPDMLEAGTTPFTDNFQNFYLSGGEFVIVFPPYQVGPWAIGTQEVRIPRSELSSVLKTDYH